MGCQTLFGHPIFIISFGQKKSGTSEIQKCRTFLY